MIEWGPNGRIIDGFDRELADELELELDEERSSPLGVSRLPADEFSNAGIILDRNDEFDGEAAGRMVAWIDEADEMTVSESRQSGHDELFDWLLLEYPSF